MTSTESAAPTAQVAPKAILYHSCPGSVWASVPILTAYEKGFTEEHLEKRYVNLLEGENFSPAFLKISPRGTVPALVVPIDYTVTDAIPTKFKALTDSISISAFLDTSTLPSSHAAPSLSPATVQGATVADEIIKHLHTENAPDPNALLLSFRNEAERKAKWEGKLEHFLKGRQSALEKYSKEAPESDSRLRAFYEEKLKANGGLIAIYTGQTDPTDFNKQAQQAWHNVGKTLSILEERFSGIYVLGDQISIADMHLAAWLARIFATAGAKALNPTEAIGKLTQQLGGQQIGPKTSRYIEAIFNRDSFKQVYKEGLH